MNNFNNLFEQPEIDKTPAFQSRKGAKITDEMLQNAKRIDDERKANPPDLSKYCNPDSPLNILNAPKTEFYGYEIKKPYWTKFKKRYDKIKKRKL